VKFRVLTNSTLLAFQQVTRASSQSPTNDIGGLPDNEVAFFIPLLQLGGRLPKLAFWLPYLFINQPLGMTMGREVWGYTKTMATVQLPTEPGATAPFEVRTSLFDRFGHNENGKDDAFILSVTDRCGTSATSAPARSWSSVSALLRSWAPGLAALLPDAGESFANLVNLKQFRDIADSRRACYQALVECPMAPTLRGPIELLDTSNLVLTLRVCESHSIVEHLGLVTKPGPAGCYQTVVADVPQGFRLKMDFVALHGRPLWEQT
jgi:hypothetical protein